MGGFERVREPVRATMRALKAQTQGRLLACIIALADAGLIVFERERHANGQGTYVSSIPLWSTTLQGQPSLGWPFSL